MASMPAKRLVPSSPAPSYPSMWDMGLGSRTSRPDIRFSGLFPLTDKEADPELRCTSSPDALQVCRCARVRQGRSPHGRAQGRVLDRPCARRPLARVGRGEETDFSSRTKKLRGRKKVSPWPSNQDLTRGTPYKNGSYKER